jgi:hypothetical protein
MTKDIRIDYSMPWQANHFRSIESAYRSSPFYEHYIDYFAPLFESKSEFLMDLNEKILHLLLKILAIQIPVNLTPSYPFPGTPDYLDLRSHIHPKGNNPTQPYGHFVAKKYTQVFGEKHGFLPGLSILDLLFNLGPETKDYLNHSCNYVTGI